MKVVSNVFAILCSLIVFGCSSKDDFHIYLAFGQSNMEGSCPNVYEDNDVTPNSYKENVDPRFQVMTAVAGNYKIVDGCYQQREQGKWYTAVPPLVRSNLCLSPVDYFGRTIVANTPSNIKVGVIVVAAGGMPIECFEKKTAFCQDMFLQIYDNSPYKRLVDLAKEAQKVGVIKGILMHQGEGGAASGAWAEKVKGIYDNLLNDLGLPPNSIPFLAGEPLTINDPNANNAPLVRSLTNTMTAKLPNGKNVAYVISSKGCSGNKVNHFDFEGYKCLGERYGQKMLELLY